MPQTLNRTELLNVHSEEIQEIVGQAPRAIFRLGTSVCILIIMLLVGVSFFVKYSELLTGQFTLTTANAPKSVIAKREGKLQALLVKEKDTVRQGQVLAYLESNASHAEVIKLSSELNTIWSQISNNEWEKILEHKPAAFQKLGELQSAYQTFVAVYIQLNAFLKDGMFVQKKRLLQHELSNFADLKANLQEQEKVHQQDYVIATEDFKAKEKLYEEKVIPLLEYKQEQSKLLGKKIPIENIHANIIYNNTTTANKKQELLQLEQQLADQKSNFLQALNTLISNVDEWKRNFLFVAPVSGIVTWPALLQEQQDVKTSQELFYIAPVNTAYLGEIYVAQESFGKLQPGQQVLISLSGYPYQEFGKIHGRVSFISNVPNKDHQYYVAVSLENGLQTDQLHRVQFRNGLAGTAEIITSKTRLINKFLFTMRKIIDRPQKNKTGHS
jgi:multidrug efflux pump subunit AcrA (membrane-fusion protein)